jgi:hypothetical protein
MVVDDLEDASVEPFPTDQPVSPTVVTTAPIMAQPDGHLNKNPVEFALPGAVFRVVSPVEPFDHTPLRGRDRTIRPPGYFRLRRTVCKMPPLLM